MYDIEHLNTTIVATAYCNNCCEFIDSLIGYSSFEDIVDIDFLCDVSMLQITVTTLSFQCFKMLSCSVYSRHSGVGGGYSSPKFDIFPQIFKKLFGHFSN